MTDLDARALPLVGAETQPRRSIRAAFRSPLRRFSRNRSAVVGALALMVVGLAALLGPLVAPDPLHVNVALRLQPPGTEGHLLGTDALGRDILARVLDGGRVSLLVAIVSSVVALMPAMLIGVTAGYFRGFVDDALSRIFDVLLTFPTLLLAIIVVAALGPSLGSIIVAVGVAYVPRYGRLFRALTLATREREYIQAANALGYSDLRVAAIHILPNILLPVIVIAAGNMGRVALAEASLSFLGAGVQVPQPSWGNMIAEGQRFLQYYPWVALVPGVILTVVTVSFAFVGDGLRDAYDVKDVPRVR